MSFLIAFLAVSLYYSFVILFQGIDTCKMKDLYFSVLASARYPNLTTFSLSHCIYYIFSIIQ